MAFEVTQGRSRKCKTQIGGIKAAYIASYAEALRSEIIYDGISLTGFPQTFIYKFELIYGDVFQQQMNDSEGGKYYDINLTLTFNRITAFDNMQFQKLLNRDWFIVVQDNNDNYFLLGFKNGLIVEKLDVSNNEGQYKITFTGMEEDSAPFCETLIGTDFIIVDGDQKQFQDGDSFIFQDNNNYIFQ